MFGPKLSKEDELRLEQLAGPSVIERFLGRDNRKRRLAKSTEEKESHTKVTFERSTKKNKSKEYYP